MEEAEAEREEREEYEFVLSSKVCLEEESSSSNLFPPTEQQPEQ